MDALALCVPIGAPDPPYYMAGPSVGVVRLVGPRWRPCRHTARVLDLVGESWPHREAAIAALRFAMFATGRRYMLRTASSCRTAAAEKAALAALRRSW